MLTYRDGLPRNLTAAEVDANVRDIDARLVDLAALVADLVERVAALEGGGAARVAAQPLALVAP